jgi:3-hydroxybutyryl-CoA dehydratase
MSSEVTHLQICGVGMCATFAKTIIEADIVLFAVPCPATTTPSTSTRSFGRHHFKGRIAHGMLFGKRNLRGDRLPGPGSIYVSQSLAFRAQADVQKKGSAKRRNECPIL